ncbi:MAG: thioredoxin domain-containing protein [Candidatus Paceibacterota bacterium]|jgi:protein-disulfide isomerase
MQPQKQSISIPIAIVIAGALIGFSIYMSGKSASKPAVADPNVPQAGNVQMAPVSANDHILGNPDAKIVIVEYSDTECPFCKRFHTTLKQIMKEYGAKGDVAWVYRSFPIPSLHPKAQKEAEALECAAELGGNTAFWKYTDRIYEITPANNGLDAAELPKIAEYAGLDVAAFNSCLSSGSMAAKVKAQVDDGITAGARGTPYSVLVTKTEKVPITQGALPYESMKVIIDSLLK